MASVPNRNSVDEQIFQQNANVLGRQSPPVEQPSSVEDFISIANSDSRLLLCRYSSSGSATGGGISGASDGMPIGHESLVGSVGSGSDRLAHYGSTSTTFSTGSFNLTGTNFGGGNSCSLDQSSMASSSGVATMSSTDYLPTTNDFVSSLSRSSADDSTPTMSTLTGEGGTAVALRRELEPLLSGAASTLSTSTTTGIMSNNCSTVATTLSNLSLNSPVCPSTSCICPSVLNTKTASTTTTATTTSASIEDSSVADDFMSCSPLLASYEQAQSTPSLHWSGAIVDARENNNNNGRLTSTANKKWEKSATPSEQQKNQSKQTGTKIATSADKLTGSCGGKRRATAMHQKMEEAATASQNCGSSDGADREREQQCCHYSVGSSAKQNCRTTVTTTKGADPITSMASTTTSMAPPINLPPSTSSSTAVLLPVQPQHSSSQNISPTSSSAAFHQTHHYSLLGSSPLPSMFNCAATSVCSQIICTPLRTIVSQNRRRYQMDGFNLDLTYITDRIIAMGYPADTKEALYRNSMSHIVKFLEHYHPGHYKVFNLRGQYVYDPANFHNRVVTFEMADHHPPRLELMAPFCREVHDYLDEDPQNVVAVHCKAGKGRTGVMICAYLCYIAFYRTPRQNMDYYSIIRTHNNKGVTIPSQRRYVYYFSHLRARQLNYMPLRCELVGVYLEKPPKLNGPFSKGALKVRVACGDVDVFLGDDLWLNGERFEEEEELHKRYPLMLGGEDQYDPLNPDDLSKSCVSRRCYGWTVPANKRVFLEGDIRLDIFQKSRLKLFNVKQERKKIGHIWFNTMFTCPGFCGGPYVHGDEAYPYPESMIVQRRFKKKQTCGNADVAMDTEGNEQQSLAQQMQQQQPHYYHHPFSHSSPSFAAHYPASAPAIVAAATAISDNCSSTTATTTDCSSADECAINPGQKRLHKHSLRFGAIKLTNGNGSDNAVSANETTKKRFVRSPCRHLFESEQKGWQSQDSGVTVENKSAQVNQKPCRSSLDTAECDYEEEIVVEKAPGLERHCPPESLRSIYPNEKMAPRYGIEEMVREAFQKNLINDIYNSRRMSQPRDGPLITKAPEGRPNANGPFCLIRRSDEHVHVFGVQEIDRAYKNKDIDLGFKVYIITRCIDESIPSDLRLAEQFVRITHQKQTQKDNQKLEKMQMRQRKMIIAQHQQMMNTHQMQTTSASAIQQQKSSNASTSTEDGFSVSASSCIVPSPTSSAYESSSVPTFGIGDIEPVTEDCSTPISPDQFEPAKKQLADDPRLSDPYLQKYFFRQRVTSHSRHPSVHHHCSLRKPDPNVCAKFGCNGIDSTPTAIIHQHSQSTQASFSSSYQKTTVTTIPKVQSHLAVPHQNRYCVNNLIRNSGDEGDNEEFEEGEADIEEEDACSFDDFDFFHPRQHTSSTVRAVSFSNYSRSNKNNNGTKQNSGTTAQPIIYTTAPSTSSSFSTSGDGLKLVTDETTENLTNELPSSVHCQNENMPMIDHDGVEGVKLVSTTHGKQHFTALPPATICGAKDSISSAPVSLLSEPMEPEVYHPSDCSLAPSTSSSCSSSD